MWFLGLPIWTCLPPCGPAVLFEDSWSLGNEEVFIQNNTQRPGSWSIFPSPDSFFSGQEVCRHWIFVSYPLSTPVLSSALCPGQMLPVILEHCDEENALPQLLISEHIFCTCCMFSASLYQEYLVVQ